MKVVGIFALNKPLGISSQRAVQIVKYWARRKSGNKKIKVGHAGTLDPLASGVLVVAVGREYTKDISNIVASEKEYIADITLGQVSTTDDAEGEKTVVNENKKPIRADIEKIVKKFIGDREQLPPVYSAIKIDGQEAYKRVRRGEDVQMKKRQIHIENIEIISYEYPQLKIRVVCGKGTYIRSLARDIGDNLHTGAYLSGLVRTRVGDFVLEDARDVKEFCMKIAVHASELDAQRIDGTRVYISEMLKRFGNIATDDTFLIYHQDTFNKSIAPPQESNYMIKKLSHIPLWTQTRFAFDVMHESPDVVWMPLHNLPVARLRNTKFVVTIHDLAFKIFPETFPPKDVKKLNFLTNYAVKNADHIIAVSKATKRDLLRFYPHLTKEKITVVHHGFDAVRWQKKVNEREVKKVLQKYNITSGQYLIHVGAVQPRKNLKTLIDAFVQVKEKHKNMKLVLVGGNGWLWQKTREYAQKNKYTQDIIFTGNIPFEDVVTLVRSAKVFVFPSLYEGFGIAGLEALASGTPVVAARNSSIPEVLGNAAIYFDAQNSNECAECVIVVIDDRVKQENMITVGLKRVEKFSWDKCARKTLRVLRK